MKDYRDWRVLMRCLTWQETDNLRCIMGTVSIFSYLHWIHGNNCLTWFSFHRQQKLKIRRAGLFVQNLCNLFFWECRSGQMGSDRECTCGELQNKVPITFLVKHWDWTCNLSRQPFLICNLIAWWVFPLCDVFVFFLLKSDARQVVWLYAGVP